MDEHLPTGPGAAALGGGTLLGVWAHPDDEADRRPDAVELHHASEAVAA